MDDEQIMDTIKRIEVENGLQGQYSISDNVQEIKVEKSVDIDSRVKEIKEKALEVYNKKKEELKESQSKDLIKDIKYYEELTLTKMQGQTGLGETAVYVVTTINEKGEQELSIYSENLLIATVNSNGNLEFTKEYMQILQERDKVNKSISFYDMAKNKSKDEVFSLPDELGQKDVQMSKEELEHMQDEIDKKVEEGDKKTEDNEKDIKNEEENAKEDKEEKELEEVAKLTGMKKEDIKASNTISPKTIVTEKQSFEQIAGIVDKYKTIHVVRNSQMKAKGNNIFTFVGIDKDGKAEVIDELKTRGSTYTDRSVYTSNREGVIEEKQVTELYSTGDPNKNFSVTIEDNGKIAVDYLRKSPAENEWIGLPVETNYHKYAQTEVKKTFDDSRTSKEDVNEMAEETKEQIGKNGIKGENESETTKLENIDNNPNNDKIENYDEEIILHDDTVTTIRQEAEKYEMSVERYTSLLEQEEGECYADRIESLSVELERARENEPVLDREKEIKL